MIWIHVGLWSRLLVSSCSARPQGDKDVISRYLWLAKWRSPSSTCPSCQPVMAPINQAQSCHWQESSSRTPSPWCTTTPPMCTCDMQAWALQNPHGTIIQPLSPSEHKQWEVSPYFCMAALISSERQCSTHMQQLHSNLPYQACMERWVYPSWTLATATWKGNYSVLNWLSECVTFDFLSNQQ